MPLNVKNPHLPSSKHFPAKKNMRKILMTLFAPVLGEKIYKIMVFYVVE